MVEVWVKLENYVESYLDTSMCEVVEIFRKKKDTWTHDTRLGQALQNYK